MTSKPFMSEKQYISLKESLLKGEELKLSPVFAKEFLERFSKEVLVTEHLLEKLLKSWDKVAGSVHIFKQGRYCLVGSLEVDEDKPEPFLALADFD